VLDRDERHPHAGERAERSRPLTGAERHHLAADLAMLGDDANHPALIRAKADDRAVLDHPDAAPARAFGQGLSDVRGVGLAVGRQKGGADQVGCVHQRPQLFRLGRR
jgi:hypothetical protein